MSLNPIQKANLSSVIASVLQVLYVILCVIQLQPFSLHHILHLQVTRSLISSPFTKHDESSKEWMEIFQSSVATVVEFSNEGLLVAIYYICESISVFPWSPHRSTYSYES